MASKATTALYAVPVVERREYARTYYITARDAIAARALAESGESEAETGEDRFEVTGREGEEAMPVRPAPSGAQCGATNGVGICTRPKHWDEFHVAHVDGSVWKSWTETPVAPMAEDRRDWQYEVRNGDTVLGLAEWLEHRTEASDG